MSLLNSGECVCFEGLYWSGSACVDCDRSCQACSGPQATQCTRCADSMYLSSGSCVCKDGFYLDGINCKICSSSCATCNGAGSGNCLSCKADYIAQPSRNCYGKCNNVECMCAAGCYPEMLESSECHSECDSCRSSNCTCKNCGDGQFRNGCSCYPCPQGCKTCLEYDSQSCTSCLNGFEPSSSNDDVFACISLSCQINESCSSGQYFDTNECRCKGCDFTCSDCLGPSNYECRACYSTYFSTSESSVSVVHCACNPDCESYMLGDGSCDDVCNTRECGYDEEDCESDSSSSSSKLSDKMIITIASVVGSFVFM